MVACGRVPQKRARRTTIPAPPDWPPPHARVAASRIWQLALARSASVPLRQCHLLHTASMAFLVCMNDCANSRASFVLKQRAASQLMRRRLPLSLSLSPE